mmetsp:Transcript_18596/g.41568  ORF Transcript_18596/g.41568 Transcript_18596/m.41568 type:complete len:82 (-) Transcript_18596:461-706(-)
MSADVWEWDALQINAHLGVADETPIVVMHISAPRSPRRCVIATRPETTQAMEWSQQLSVEQLAEEKPLAPPSAPPTALRGQ